MEFGFIALNEISLDDRTFEIRKFGSDDRLQDSFAQVGVLDPLWVQKRGARYVVVDGFKRLRWLAGSGIEGWVCRIFPEDASSRKLWVRRIEKRLFEPGLDIPEKARIVSVLLDIFPPAEIPRPVLGALNISPRPDLLQAWARLSTEKPELLEVLSSGEISERAALEVAHWEPEMRAALFSTLKGLRCSASIQVEIIERIDEIAIREEKPRTDIFGSPQVQGILSSKSLNHRQKTRALRELLTQRRYPRLSARERQVHEILQSLALPPPVRIIPPPALEGSNWRLELTFSGPADLRNLVETARELAVASQLEPLFDSPAMRGKKAEEQR